jgi:hypothetical protein
MIGMQDHIQPVLQGVFLKIDGKEVSSPEDEQEIRRASMTPRRL